MKIKTIVIIAVLLIAGYAFAQKMDDGVNNPLIGGIKKLIAGKAGADSVTVKAGSAEHMLDGQVMVSVHKIIKTSEGNGVSFAVMLPHKGFTAKVYPAKRYPVQVNGQTYYLDLVSVSDSAATFRIQKGVNNANDES